MANAEDVNRLTACSLVLLGHIFLSLGSNEVSGLFFVITVISMLSITYLYVCVFSEYGSVDDRWFVFLC